MTFDKTEFKPTGLPEQPTLCNYHVTAASQFPPLSGHFVTYDSLTAFVAK